MEKKRILKIKAEKIAKRLDFPNDFISIIEKIKEFVPLIDPNKAYQLIEEKSKKEINNEEDFQKMSKENQNENLIKMSVNIVDINSIPISIKNPSSINKPYTNFVSYETSINILGNKKEENKIEIKEEIKEKKEIKENNEENEIENTMKSILKEKMKELEDKLVEELYNNLQNEITKSKLNNNNAPKIIEEEKLEICKVKTVHEGIYCNKCGKNNIEGVRYKCAQCANFNLCENCEENYIHDIKHIMIKIKYPIKNESELMHKINRNISYKNQGMNYDLEPKIFNLEGGSDIGVHQVNLKNTGISPWRGVTLRCIEDKSEIIGEDCDFKYNVNSGSSINGQIIFNDLKKQLKPGKYIYYCFFQMFNQQNESFGNVTKIKVKIKN
jgi:hypothetical protein